MRFAFLLLLFALDILCFRVFRLLVKFYVRVNYLLDDFLQKITVLTFGFSYA